MKRFSSVLLIILFVIGGCACSDYSEHDITTKRNFKVYSEITVPDYVLDIDVHGKNVTFSASKVNIEGKYEIKLEQKVNLHVSALIGRLDQYTATYIKFNVKNDYLAQLSDLAANEKECVAYFASKNNAVLNDETMRILDTLTEYSEVRVIWVAIKSKDSFEDMDQVFGIGHKQTISPMENGHLEFNNYKEQINGNTFINYSKMVHDYFQYLIETGDVEIIKRIDADDTYLRGQHSTEMLGFVLHGKSSDMQEVIKKLNQNSNNEDAYICTYVAEQ